MIAYVHTEINEPSLVDSLNEQLNATPISKNIFARDFVSKFIGIWSMGYETVENILSVMRTSQIVN
jgi:hypothetical protein